MTDDGGLGARLAGVLRVLSMFVGLFVFGVGLLVAFVPGMERAVPIEAMIALLGSDYFVLAVVGAVAVGLALLVLLAQAVAGVDQADVPVVESVESAPHPGEAVDRSVGGGDEQALAASRQRLHEAAVRTLMRSDHSSRSTAERSVAEGSWTDDEVAADYLAGDDGGLFRTAVSDEDRIRQTARAIAAVGGDGSVTPTGGASDDGDGDSDGDDEASRDGFISSPSRNEAPAAHERGREVASDGAGRGGR